MIKRNIGSEGEKEKSGNNSHPKTLAKPKQSRAREEDRHHWILEAAYYRAERRGFVPGEELDDWLAAEAEIDGSLQEKPFSQSIF
jgi:hypothetical protein